MAETTEDEIQITYLLRVDEQPIKSFYFKFDKESFLLKNEAKQMKDEWVALDHCKCDHCPLRQKAFPNCPIAENLAQVATEYKDLKSYDEVQVSVKTEDRNYTKRVSLQDALYSMFGLIMATSECPYMGFLRPMARFHLPFSNYEETAIRTLSFYLIDQYLLDQQGGEGDFTLEGLKSRYEAVQKVNRGLIKRVKSMSTGDADANSIAILDGFVQLLSFDFESGFKNLQQFFPDRATT